MSKVQVLRDLFWMAYEDALILMKTFLGINKDLFRNLWLCWRTYPDWCREMGWSLIFGVFMLLGTLVITAVSLLLIVLAAAFLIIGIPIQIGMLICRTLKRD